MLEYTADRRIAINKQDVTIVQLETRLRNIFEQRNDKTMFIVGDGSLKYKDIVDVIDAAKGAGVEKVGIVTEGMRKAGGRQRQLVRFARVVRFILERPASLSERAGRFLLDLICLDRVSALIRTVPSPLGGPVSPVRPRLGTSHGQHRYVARQP